MATVGRVVTPKLEIAWNGSSFVDETANLISARGETKLTAPGSAIMSPRGTVDRMTLSLYNRDEAGTGRRYSPLNTSGALYASISSGGAYHKPVRFSVSIDGGIYNRIFTGVIKIPQEGVPTPKGEATVDIDCRSVDELLLQLRISTASAVFKSNIDSGLNEAQLIAQVLEHAGVGLSSSDYTLDGGLFSVPYFWLDDESVLEELWQLAAATGGRLYASHDGKIVYENMQHWVLHSTSTETFTRANYDGLRIKYEDSDLYSVASVEASPRRIGALAVLWEPDESILVPAGGTRTVTAQLKQPAYVVNSVTYRARSSAGYNLNSSVSLARTDYAQRVELTFTNAHSTLQAQIEALQISGQPVLGAPSIEESATSSNAFWTSRKPRSRSLRGNNYIQARAQAKALAEFLRDTQELPKLTYQLSGVLGVATRRLGARITINDTAAMSAARDAYVTGISWTFTDKGYRQTIDAMDAASLYKYAASDYFILDTSTLNGGDRVFY